MKIAWLPRIAVWLGCMALPWRVPLASADDGYGLWLKCRQVDDCGGSRRAAGARCGEGLFRAGDDMAISIRKGLCGSLVLLLAALLFPLCGCGGPEQVGASDIARIKGRWERPDGGYVLELDNAGSDAGLKASYYNPRRIDVSRTEIRRKDGALQIFIELRDVGYPGCTYDLIYDPASDMLRGTYHQAALQQDFEVVFVRLKE